MIQENSLTLLKNIANFLFERDFLQISQGSISAKIDKNQFIINKKEAILSDLDDKNFQILSQKKDFRWENVSDECDIHQNIYKNIAMAKFFCFTTPPNLLAYSLNHDVLIAKDFGGYLNYENLKIYDPKNFSDWMERAPGEILNFLQTNKTNIMLVRGVGVFIYEKCPVNLAKIVVGLENSAKILQIYETNKNIHV